MTDLTPNYTEALRLLRIFTNGTYDIYSLAGGGNVTRRQQIMGAVQGFKPPQSKVGVNAMIATFYDVSGVSMLDGTLRAKEHAFSAWAHEHGDQLDKAM